MSATRTPARCFAAVAFATLCATAACGISGPDSTAGAATCVGNAAPGTEASAAVEAAMAGRMPLRCTLDATAGVAPHLRSASAAMRTNEPTGGDGVTGTFRAVGPLELVKVSEDADGSLELEFRAALSSLRASAE
jgi:hypothetical protein